MTQASPDLRPPGFAALPADVRAQLDLVIGPVDAVAADLDELRARNAAHLAAERRQGLDPAMIEAFERAAKTPGAPESLKRVARRVGLGQLRWDDVFGPGADTANPDVADLRREAFATARAQFDRSDWEVTIVPEPTSESDGDPDSAAGAGTPAP